MFIGEVEILIVLAHELYALNGIGQVGAGDHERGRPVLGLGVDFAYRKDGLFMFLLYFALARSESLSSDQVSLSMKIQVIISNE